MTHEIAVDTDLTFADFKHLSPEEFIGRTYVMFAMSRARNRRFRTPIRMELGNPRRLIAVDECVSEAPFSTLYRISFYFAEREPMIEIKYCLTTDESVPPDNALLGSASVTYLSPKP